jgi:uncharacterized Zn-binding protein involved in type VI secretion
MTGHGPPLNPGPGSLDVKIGFMPAWRAVPAGMGAGIDDAAAAMKDLMGAATLDPVSTPAKLGKVFASLMQDSGKAAAKGAPGAPGAASGGFSTLMATNVTLTATYTSAAAVPGGEPAARQAYTEGIKAAAAAFASAAMSAMGGITDMHVCPIPCPIPPHGPGVVTKGSKSVVINNLPACRQGDKVMEACGGSDPIAMGCPTVLIGDDGGGPASPDTWTSDTSDDIEQQLQAQSAAAALADAAQSGVPLIEITKPCGGLGKDKPPKTRVAFQVLDEDTGEPQPGVRLTIRLPDGEERTYTTDAGGMVEIDDLEKPGTCAVSCDLAGATFDDTFAFVRMESKPY